MEEKDSIAKDFAALFYHFSNLSKYSEEEYNAMYGKIPMTEEIFEKCVGTALSIYDFGNIKFLKEKFPEFVEKSILLQKKK
ncbi:MAG: hypothetical protein IJE28_09760 [Oscillospiraceae bacterium]|nr:hypothetical protein [Oscillospiraceae bacterium]